MKYGIRWLAGWLLILLALHARAGQAPLEFDFLSRFANSELERSERREAADHRVILGQLRIIGNQIRSEELRLAGELTRLTYLIPSGYSSATVFNHYLTQLTELNARILFRCSSRDCGRSSEWATDVFRIANLYGLDREQNYLVAALERDGRPYHVVLYTVLRGNQRVYAHLEVLAGAGGEGSAQAPTGVTSTVARATIPLRNDEFTLSLPETLADFVARAQQEKERQIWIVVHTEGESLAEARSRGQSIGERVRLWLQSRGLSESRIQILALGPLAPAHDPAIPPERVEVYLVTP